MKEQHELASIVAAQIIADYDGLVIDATSLATQQFRNRLERTIHAAINHDLESEIEPTTEKP